MKAKELVERSGATYRQVDHWCRNGVIPTVGNSLPGSGSHREFSEGVIGPVSLLAKVSAAFGQNVGVPTLKSIFDNYEYGLLDLGGGVILEWEVGNG